MSCCLFLSGNRDAASSKSVEKKFFESVELNKSTQCEHVAAKMQIAMGTSLQRYTLQS